MELLVKGKIIELHMNIVAVYEKFFFPEWCRENQIPPGSEPVVDQEFCKNHPMVVSGRIQGISIFDINVIYCLHLLFLGYDPNAHEDTISDLPEDEDGKEDKQEFCNILLTHLNDENYSSKKCVLKKI
jgi:hypothetical protein